MATQTLGFLSAVIASSAAMAQRRARARVPAGYRRLIPAGLAAHGG